jgi:mannose-6-phosphate isomerase-like protein (cupin superfamily)
MEEDKNKAFVPDWLKNDPFPPDCKKPVVVKKGGGVRGTFGESHRVASDVYISTDKILMGDFVVPPGECFDPPDIHNGIEVYYIASGNGVCFDPDSGNSVSLSAGDVVILPKDLWHQTFNFGEGLLTVLTLIEANAWSDADGMGTAVVYPDEPQYYMPDRRE